MIASMDLDMDTGTPLAAPTPAKASRRTHAKTRTGCKTCKSRKIKCDEEKPQCRNCTKHNVSCDYLHAPSPRHNGSTLSPECSGRLNMADLELLHHYTTSTYATLTDNIALRDFYRCTYVELGLRCEYIMRTIFALAALHLAHYRPSMRSHYLSLAAEHHQIASREALAAMNQLGPDTAPNLFIFSALTVFYAFGSPRKEHANDILFFDTTTSGVPDWIFLLRGSFALVKTLSVEERQKGPLAPVFGSGRDSWNAREAMAAAPDPDSERASRLDALEGFLSRPREHVPAHHRAVYLHWLHELRKSMRHNDQALGDATVFMWLFDFPDEVLPLLKQPTQEVLLILAHFVVLLDRMSARWWVQGWAAHLMGRIWSLLEDEYKIWVRWPMEQLGWVPP
ncbi:uncharacterized protein B0I36DRAFT_314313 [Microdochium trichocladiopsis]|uniref:Zn(2)-C6 fungal-type domain-containing protein n=1 Tax=Microdochium trichocladiopsis TaxID=1682393 RepID=A0A9P9BTZ9_9PEZI|nr:uncharacterized protein B0I36DRAFT_314313 [Microdochium trichocladiopsis]KAH7037557.1 hypothetical protein B0I36DRAFT_314313 [Microdochium trichocladiopsis]